MYRLWLKVLDDGRIRQSLFTLQEDPEGYNYVVEESTIIASLREKLDNWYVKDEQLCRREEITLIATPSKEGMVSANGVDHYTITVGECALDIVKVKFGAEVIDLPTDEELILKSDVPTMLDLYSDEKEYATARIQYLEFI